MITESMVIGIALGGVILCVIAGSINELIYFNGLCRRTKQGYADLQEDINKWKPY